MVPTPEMAYFKMVMSQILPAHPHEKSPHSGISMW